jgi:hypothetical protein
MIPGLPAIAAHATVVLATHAVDDSCGAADASRYFDGIDGAVHTAGPAFHTVLSVRDSSFAVHDGEDSMGAHLFTSATTIAKCSIEYERMTVQ